MVKVTLEVPESLLPEVYIAVGRVLRRNAVEVGSSTAPGGSSGVVGETKPPSSQPRLNQVKDGA
jgi:hypothetical protein